MRPGPRHASVARQPVGRWLGALCGARPDRPHHPHRRAELRVTDHVGRCDATSADTDSGTRDIDMVQTLDRLYGHTDFGIFAEVVTGGPVRLQDQVHA